MYMYRPIYVFALNFKVHTESVPYVARPKLMGYDRT